MNYFKQNLSFMQQHRPDILPKLNTQVASTQPSDLNKKDNDPIDFSQLFGDLNTDHNTLIFLIGFGLGHEAKEITRHFPSFRLVILEPDADLFTTAMHEEDQRSLISNPNIAINIGSDINIAQIIQQEDDALRALPFRLIVNKKLQTEQPNRYNSLYSSLQAALLNFKGKLTTIVKLGPLLFQNTLSNAQQLGNIVPINNLNNMAQDLPVICVAAGPSLSKNIEQLKGQEQHFLIIAVDSASKVLLDHGITPHLIVTIDPITLSLVKLRDVIKSNPDIPLALTPEAYPETIAGFTDSPKFIIPGVNDLFQQYLAPLLQDTSTFPNMVSVSHAATQITNILGANTLIFIGLDLALNANQDHVEGCPVSWEKFGPDDRIKIPSWDGGEVETVAVLQNQLTALQEIINSLTDIQFIDATEGGALISGTTPMSLSDALQKFRDVKKDYTQEISTCFEQTEKPNSKRVNNTLKKLKKDLKQSLKIANTGLRSGKEARLNWKLSKIPKKRSQALKKFKKNIITSGKSFDKMMDLLDLTNAIYPLRADAHHQFIYARKMFNETVDGKTEEAKIFDELDENIDYFESWISTVKEAEKIIAETENSIPK